MLWIMARGLPHRGITDRHAILQRCSLGGNAVEYADSFVPAGQVDDLLAKLGNVGMLRQMLSPHLAASPAADDGSQPLIQSVAAAIAGRQQIPGLQHHSASLRWSPIPQTSTRLPGGARLCCRSSTAQTPTVGQTLISEGPKVSLKLRM